MFNIERQPLRELAKKPLSIFLSTLSIFVGRGFVERFLGFLRELFASSSLNYRPQYSAACGLIERGER